MPRSITPMIFIAALLLGGIVRADFEALPDAPLIPPDNLMTPPKIELGRQLFFDKRLSRTNEISCNSCHDVQGSGTDKTRVSTGIEGRKGSRRAPTVWNAAFQSVQFWDGRAATLEEQAKGPMVNPLEMGMSSHGKVMKRIAAIPGYVTQFQTIFGEGGLTIANVARAIAAYERTLVTPNSPYDRFIKGDKSAMSAAAQAGMKLVQSVGCVSCHMGYNFSGPALPAGTGWFQKFPTYSDNEYATKYHFTDDPGRFAVTKNEADRNTWRVPTWRNVELRAPYFHNGQVETLEEAVRVMAKVQLNKTLKPREVENIVAFLKSLTGERPKQETPKLPH